MLEHAQLWSQFVSGEHPRMFSLPLEQHIFIILFPFWVVQCRIRTAVPVQVFWGAMGEVHNRDSRSCAPAGTIEQLVYVRKLF